MLSRRYLHGFVGHRRSITSVAQLAATLDEINRGYAQGKDNKHYQHQGHRTDLRMAIPTIATDSR